MGQLGAGELLVDRQQLADAIRGSPAVCTFVVAPAGYGKSHLTRLVLNAQPSAICDVAGADSIASFGRRLIASMLAAGMPDDGNLVRALATLPDTAAADDSWNALLNAVCSNGAGPRFLVFENAECLAGNEKLLEQAARCVRSAAGHIRVIVCSRVPLTSASFLRMAPSELLHIGAAELRFTQTESRKLLRSAGARATDLSEAVEIAAGWPVAVLLFARDAQTGKLRKRLGRLREDRNLSEYIGSQVLSDFDPEFVELLGATARLGTASAEDLKALGTTASQLLSRSGYHPFVVQSEDSVTIHPMARAALNEVGAGMALLKMAAEQCADLLIAARFLIANGDIDGAAELLGTKLAPYMAGRVSHGLARIVAEIDEQTLCRHPAAWCATIILRRCTISNAQSLAEGHAVWKQLDESTPVAVRLGVGTVLVNDLLLNGRADEARPIVQRLNEWIAREPEGAGGSALIVELYDRWMALREGQIPKGNSDYRRRMLPLLETATETRALFHYEFDAREALMRFDCDAASRAHARAVETARMAESPTPRLIIFPGVAFFAWLMGDDEQFRSLLSEMADLNRPPTDVSCRHFLECALGDATLSLRLNELPYQSAFAEIIGAARTSGAARESLSLAALQAAEEDGSAIVLTLALLCRAFCCAAERTAAFEKAASYARRIETGAWTEAIVQLQNRQGPFKAFAARFDAAREEALRLLIGERQLLNGDRQIPLTPREVAVFLALERASRDVGATELASILLPNEDEDSAATALRVRINRIRAKAAPLKAILSSNSGYALPTGFRTDLAEAEQIVRLLERGEKPSDEQMRRLERFAQAGLGRLTLEWADFEFGAAVLRRLEDVRRRSLLALARRAREYGDFTTACHWASIAREQDPFDEEAAAIVVEMYARLGRHAEAERMAREFSEQLYGELGVRPRAEVFAMLRSKRQT